MHFIFANECLMGILKFFPSLGHISLSFFFWKKKILRLSEKSAFSAKKKKKKDAHLASNETLYSSSCTTWNDYFLMSLFVCKILWTCVSDCTLKAFFCRFAMSAVMWPPFSSWNQGVSKWSCIYWSSILTENWFTV